MALQEAAEAYLVSLFEDTNLAAIHAKRTFCPYVLPSLSAARLMTLTDSSLSVPLIGVTMCVTSLPMLALYIANYLIIFLVNPRTSHSHAVSVGRDLKCPFPIAGLTIKVCSGVEPLCVAFIIISWPSPFGPHALWTYLFRERRCIFLYM